MKSFVALFAAAGVALAGSIVKREESGIDPILTGINNIANETAHLTGLIATYSGPTDAGDILLAVSDLVDVVKQVDAVVLNTPGPLNINNASALIAPTESLRDNVTASINATLVKQPLFYAVGLGLEVKIQLQDIQAVSAPLTQHLVAIVPDILQATAQSLSQPILAALQEGIDAYANATGDWPGDSGASTVPANLIITAIVAASVAFFAL